ncbi:MAG TPA: hypothetical protein VFL60_10130 [Gaiellaceae bacterium]|nr:hypothetical protein [Gaiellaceae bacterium]
MATHDLRTQERDGLARFLGWFGVGLGVTQLAAPRALCRLVGADDRGVSPLVMRAMGARELLQGTGILTRTRPTGLMWSRVAGDVLDVAAVAFAGIRNRRARSVGVLASLLPIGAADVYEARHLSQRPGEPRSGKHIRKAVTISRPRQQVEEAWVAAEDLRRKVDEQGALVAFREAPGGRGTELVVDFTFDPPAGEFGVVAAKLTGNDLATELADGLRRFKSRVETGEVVRSDATPDGHLLADHLRQRAAQPLEREEARA